MSIQPSFFTLLLPAGGGGGGAGGRVERATFRQAVVGSNPAPGIRSLLVESVSVNGSGWDRTPWSPCLCGMGCQTVALGPVHVIA